MYLNFSLSTFWKREHLKAGTQFKICTSNRALLTPCFKPFKHISCLSPAEPCHPARCTLLARARTPMHNPTNSLPSKFAFSLGCNVLCVTLRTTACCLHNVFHDLIFFVQNCKRNLNKDYSVSHPYRHQLTFSTAYGTSEAICTTV